MYNAGAMIPATTLYGDAEAAYTHNLLLSWDIPDNGVAIVIGGYQGATCGMILERYPKCKLYTFEPQVSMYKVLKPKSLELNYKAYNYAIGTQDGTLPMVKAGSDFCSFVIDGPTNSIGEMREFGSVMKELGITDIAWMHFNIEKYEYILIPYLIETGWIKHIKQFVVATHDYHDTTAWTRLYESICKSHTLWWRERQFWAFIIDK